MRSICHARGAAVVLLVIATGCATPIGVRRVSEETVHRQLTGSVLSRKKPSSYSMQFLQRFSLTERFEKDPLGALAELNAGLGGPDERDRLFALSELCFAYAERHRDRPYFLAAAVYAYAFLFPAIEKEQPIPYDPRLRLALDLYNRGITAGLSRNEEEVDITVVPPVPPTPEAVAATAKADAADGDATPADEAE